MLELKSGDLCVPGSDQFSDYRKELVSEDEFERGVALTAIRRASLWS